MWTPAHEGVSPNAMADCAATHAKFDATIEDSTELVATQVQSRPCIYERRVRREGEDGEAWELADRKTYAETRKRARTYVRAKLGENTAPGSTSAGVSGPLWSEVVKGSARMMRPNLAAASSARQQPIMPEDVETFNVRTGVMMGMRVNQVCGVSHGKIWEKRRRAEGTGGGAATRSEAWGCWACKLARDAARRAAAARVPHRKSAAEAQAEWHTERDEQLESLATLRHLECGECEATSGLWRGKAGKRHVESMERMSAACTKARAESTGGNGQRVTAMVEDALATAHTVHNGGRVNDAQWLNRWAVLAGDLPAWAEDSVHDSTCTRDTEGPVRAATIGVVEAEGVVVKAVQAWKHAAAPGICFAKHREQNRGLLQLVVRLWRERAEHDAPGLMTDETRWVVRTQKPSARLRKRRRRRAEEGKSEEKKFACRPWACDPHKWNPWRTAEENTPTEDTECDSKGGETPSTMLLGWRLRDRCLRIASYYRVMRLRQQAEERRRRARTRGRFQQWAASAVAALAAEKASKQAAAAEADERERRGQRVSAATRMERKNPEVYRNGVRRYKPRATNEARRRVLINKKRRKEPTIVGAEIGRRLHDIMLMVGMRCVNERRGEG